MPKLRELNLPTGTVFVCILKNIPGRKIEMFFPNLVFLQGTRRNKQPFEPDRSHDTFDQVLFSRPDLSYWSESPECCAYS